MTLSALIARVEEGPRYEQRHFRSWLGKWSRWYPSSDAAYREHLAGPVKCYQVRPATLRALSALEDSKADLADATNGDRP